MKACVMKWTGWALLLFFYSAGGAQTVSVLSEDYILTTGAYRMQDLDAFSFLSNPACLGNFKGASAGLSIERKWMLKELGNYRFAGSASDGRNGWGIALGYEGDANYHGESAVLGYGKQLGRWQIGIQFGYRRGEAAGYAAAHMASAGLGMRIQLTTSWLLGWETDLPVWSAYGKNRPLRMPAGFGIGMGYQWQEGLFLSVSIHKTESSPASLICFLEYRYAKQLFLTVGISSSEAAPFLRAGWKKNRLTVQVYSTFVEPLGFSPGCELLWEIKSGGS